MGDIVVIAFVVASALLWLTVYCINKHKYNNEVKRFNKQNEEFKEELIKNNSSNINE